MQKELQKRMEELHMIEPNDKVLVGVSGGADSVCLLLLLSKLQQELKFTLEVVHVEHGIRGEESRGDAAFVEDLCRCHQIPCQVIEVDVPAYCKETGLGTEEAARVLRYEVFERLALEKKAKVALAHHQEDNAETILFQMARGSSLAGLCGMQPIREDANGVKYIRPLLSFRREEIEGFLRAHGLEWCEDSTNADVAYSRNFLRAKVLPDLAKVNARAVEHINQTAVHLSEMKSYLDAETERVWNTLATIEDKVVLDAKIVMELPKVLQRQVAHKAIVLVSGKGKDITSNHVEDLLDLCKGQSGKKIYLPYNVVAWKEFGSICLEQFGNTSLESQGIDREYKVSAEAIEKCLRDNSVVSIGVGAEKEKITLRIFEKDKETCEIPRKTYTKWLDYDKIKDGFCIRTRRSGDYFISDALGHKKKLKSYFIDEKIPQGERDKRWLIAQGSEILWLIGGRISEHVKVSPKTNYVFEITYDGGNKDE